MKEKIFTVTMPDIGEGVVEGEVIDWLKQINDPLKQDEPVVTVMTDKATVELPAPYPGKLAKIYYQKGEIAIRDKPLYDIELSEEVSEKIEIKHEILPEEKTLHPPAIKTPIREEKPISHGNSHSLALPSTRKRATELGIDIELIKGTGKDGRVTDEDIHTFISQTKQHISSSHLFQNEMDEEIPLLGIRNLMAKKMRESKDKIPHFSYFEQADATSLVQLRSRLKEQGQKEGIHVTFMPFFIKALSLTLLKFPEFNSSINEEKNSLTIHHVHNIGIASNTPQGLIVPVLKNVQTLSLQEVIHAYEQLKEKTVTGKLHPNDMKEATITISNYGVFGGGGLWATPIINYPETTILAVARVQKHPMVKNDQLSVRDAVNLSWSFDHRVIDGDKGARFSHHFAMLIQNPASLL